MYNGNKFSVGLEEANTRYIGYRKIDSRMADVVTSAFLSFMVVLISKYSAMVEIKLPIETKYMSTRVIIC